jgi:hypothetical protein
MQRATPQPAAEHTIDRRNAERKRARTVLDPGWSFQCQQALAQFLEHR